MARHGWLGTFGNGVAANDPHRYPVDPGDNVRCLYYMPTRRRVDLCNLLEATCDLLVHHGVLADDNSAIVAGHDGSRVLFFRISSFGYGSD